MPEDKIEVRVGDMLVGRLTEIHASTRDLTLLISAEIGVMKGPFLIGVSEVHVSRLPGEKPPPPAPRNRAEKRKRHKGK